MSTRKKYIVDNDLKENLTSIFILPMLEYPDEYFPKEFISAYLINDEVSKIVCTFENTDGEYFKNVILEMQNHDDYVGMDYDDDNKEIFVIFNIPKEFQVDFNLFKIGRYTKFSNKYKEILLSIYGRKTGNGTCIKMVDALFPDNAAKKFRADKMGVEISDLPNGEVMSLPNMEEEEYKKTSELTKIKTEG